MNRALNVRQTVLLLALASALCVGIRLRHAQLTTTESPPRGVATDVVPKGPDVVTLRAGQPDPANLLPLFDLRSLPLQSHRLLGLLLLMPLCAVATCFFRVFIGIETSGRFTPMLLAMGFAVAGWKQGVIAVLLVVALGLTTRDVLERLRLLLLPRLGILLTLVVYCFVLLNGMAEHFRWSHGPDALLLPIVILANVIERFYVTSQEEGTGVALQRLCGTGVVCFFCYLILSWESAGELLLAYPEVHLLTVAALIVMGRYRGYRIAELWRFRDLTPNCS